MTAKRNWTARMGRSSSKAMMYIKTPPNAACGGEWVGDYVQFYLSSINLFY